MYSSFYTAALGASGQMSKLGVIGNNLANINNYGYKTKNAVFTDLLYYNLNNYRGDETTIKAGTGIYMEKTDTDFSASGFETTERVYDFAILEEGFFMLRNPVTNEITYTRNGRFSLSLRGDTFYLVNDAGNLVLDANRNPIRGLKDEHGENIVETMPAIYDFAIKNGMQNVGKNEFVPVAKNGNPILRPEEPLQRALEISNVNLADELVRMIETQRAYTYALKMVQTSDEVVQTVNGLR